MRQKGYVIKEWTAMDDIILKKCTEADVDILRSLLSKTFSETFAHMNTPENMELYLSQAFARELPIFETPL